MLREKSTETELSANTIGALSQKQQNRTRFKVFFCASKEMLMMLLTFHPSSTNESPSMILVSDSDDAMPRLRTVCPQVLYDINLGLTWCIMPIRCARSFIKEEYQGFLLPREGSFYILRILKPKKKKQGKGTLVLLASSSFSLLALPPLRPTQRQLLLQLVYYTRRPSRGSEAALFYSVLP